MEFKSRMPAPHSADRTNKVVTSDTLHSLFFLYNSTCTADETGLGQLSGSCQTSNFSAHHGKLGDTKSKTEFKN